MTQNSAHIRISFGRVAIIVFPVRAHKDLDLTNFIEKEENLNIGNIPPGGYRPPITLALVALPLSPFSLLLRSVKR